MLRRIALVCVLAVLAVGCSGGGGGALDDLIEQVRLDDPLSDRTYAENQAEIEVAASIPKLTDHLANDESAKVRQYCALILGRIGDPQAVPALTAALSDADQGVRGRVVDALGQLGEDHAETAFIGALQSGSDIAKNTVLVELERAASVTAIPAIAELASSNSGMVSKNAIDALGGIGDPSAVAPLSSIALDAAAPDDLRRAAIRNLGRIPGPEAVAAIAEVITGLGEQEGTEELVLLARDQG